MPVASPSTTGRKRVRTTLLILLVVAALVGGIGAMANSRARQATASKTPPAVIKPGVVRVAALKERPYAMTESFHGLLEARAKVDLAFQISGRISQLGTNKDRALRENDRVARGDVLAKIEPLRYEAAAAVAQARAEEAKAALSGAQAAIADAQARLDDAVKERDRFKGLVDSGAAASRELDKAEVTVKLTQAALEGARARLSAATAMYDSGRAGATIAGVDLQDTELRAPIDGLVAFLPVEFGQNIAAGQRVVTIVDLTTVRLKLGVVERKLPLLKQGQKVRVEFKALETQAAVDGAAVSANEGSTSTASANPVDAGKPRGVREGLVTVVPPAADPVTGLFNVEVELPNPDGVLRPGMVGKSVVTVAEKRAIALPAEAVGRTGDEYWAFFVADSYDVGLDLGGLGKTQVTVPSPVARRCTFKPVAIDKDFVLIADPPRGLSRLVIEGHTRLIDGQPLTVIDETLTP